jgi:D-alanyl-lipoteichoic acid acyltransferase DltB (MBOAT superfamily)
MLFFSFEFLYAFLPLACIGFYLLGRQGSSLHALSLAWLVAVSLCFYAWWDSAYLALIAVSIVFNYGAGRYLQRNRQRPVLVLSIACNLLLLGWFKYLGFLTGILNAALHQNYDVGDIVLPLAISFFTFQQIAWLVDNYSGPVEEGRVTFLEYTLFVVFFPQLIAGPIVHHAEMIPQFRHPNLRRFQAGVFAAGLSIFVIGLFKKVVLADNLAPTANLVFDGAAFEQVFSVQDSWQGVLAYTLQLYFDFSGYADMAIGLGLMFNVRLPVNFDSPYKASSISEFWRRWHMTLSRFLRAYVYIPLGGNRKGKANTYLFLMITMLLGGLWHGAGWTFVIWGGLHGLFLVAERLWRAAVPWRLPPPVAWLLTFLVVTLAWVVFRAHDPETALRMIAGLFALGDQPGVSADIPVQTTVLIIGALLGALVLPNTQRLMRAHYTPIEHDRNATTAANTWQIGVLNSLQISWNNRSLAYLTALAMVSVYTLLDTSTVQEFIYFRF